MSTKHFSIHQGVFIFIRFDVNNRRTYSFGSILYQIINDLQKQRNTFFNAEKTHFYQLCLFDVQYKNFAGIVFEDHCTGISADAKMKISREMIQWFLKKTVLTGFAACIYTFQNLYALFSSQWMIKNLRDLICAS